MAVVDEKSMRPVVDKKRTCNRCPMSSGMGGGMGRVEKTDAAPRKRRADGYLLVVLEDPNVN